MWVDDAWPVSRMQRTALACQTASQVLGIDCQCASPATGRQADQQRAEQHPRGDGERRPGDIARASASRSR